MRTFALAALTVVATIRLAGCVAGTEGLSGLFTFYDRTPPAEHAFPWDPDQALDAPLAVGARLDVGVSYRGLAFRPEGVEVSPSSLASVASVNNNGFTLLATAPGRIVVTVRGATRQDQMVLDVRQPDGATVLVRPWDWYPLPASFYDKGIAILQGATSHLFGLATASGQALTGQGPYTFQPVTTVDPVIQATARAGSNFLDLQGVAPGVQQFTFGPSAPVEVAVVTEADITRVEVLEAWHTQPGPDLACTKGDTLYVLLAPYDAQGRLVVGTTTGDAPTVEILDESLPFLTDTTPANPSTELKEVLQNRAVFLHCEAAGSATATLRWRTFEKPINVTIRDKTN